MNYKQFKKAILSGEGVKVDYAHVWLDRKTKKVKYECSEGCCEDEFVNVDQAWQSVREDCLSGNFDEEN